MSILLDALKKSEEQRQLGQTPNIHSPGGQSATAGGGSQQWIPVAMMALAVLAMAWIGWQQFRLPPPSPGTEIAAAGVADDSAAAAAKPDEGTTEPAAARQPQLIARSAPRTPVESFQADTRTLQDAKVMPPPDIQDAAERKTNARQTVKTYQAKSPPAGTAAEVAAPADSSAGREPAPNLAPVDEANAPEDAARTAPHIPEPISYWELPQGIRDQLPDMHISVLVYAERPEDRFLLINGKRVLEEEVYEPGVVLQEIRRNGAVFQYRTYRFLVEG